MQTRRVVRAEQWWDSKVPAIIGVAALAIGVRPGPATVGELGDLALLLVSVVGVAAFGHVLNDWCDIEADAAGGKPNRVAGLAPGTRAALAVATLLVGLAPWLLLDRYPPALVALAVEVLLLVAYSVPPVRLKGRAWAGVVADAGYAFSVPFVLVALALGPRSVDHGVLVVSLLGAWGLLLGLRGILSHQLDDLEADRAAATGTVARRVGVPRTERLLGAVLLPLEVGLLAAVLLAVDIGWMGWLLVGFLAWRTFQVAFLWAQPLELAALRHHRQRVHIVGFEYVNDLVERWIPLAALVAVAWTSPWWWLAVAAHLVLFRTVLRTFLGRDLWVLPDGIERLAHVRRARRDVREVARRRSARVAGGAPALDDPAARRFVFVVCGPSSHVETLATALRHLRPVTQAELWVVTDTSRNATPIDHPGLDHVVDVRTPAELDDHQASIWLKTSVHRHVPAGEWCYLDSDIIAAVPGVEGVFGERRGPVAFASDVTIRENSVDRFSPWAMTCPCLGYDDEHSCGHLREQLTARFGLDVPGDWLHWNGGVFLFGPDSAEFLDLWHERAVTSFGWPEWKTRDQGALISTVWTLGLQDLPRISPEFNFIADLGNGDLCLDVDRGWAHHPSGPWYDAKLLHLYTSPLEDPAWELGADVEAVVLRRSRVHISRYRRAEAQARASHLLHQAARSRHKVAFRARTSASALRWKVQGPLEVLALKARRMPRRLRADRIVRGIRSRLGMDVSHLPVPGEPGPQRAERDAV